MVHNTHCPLGRCLTQILIGSKKKGNLEKAVLKKHKYMKSVFVNSKGYSRNLVHHVVLTVCRSIKTLKN